MLVTQESIALHQASNQCQVVYEQNYVNSRPTIVFRPTLSRPHTIARWPLRTVYPTNNVNPQSQVYPVIE